MAINKILECIIIFYAEVLNYAKTPRSGHK